MIMFVWILLTFIMIGPVKSSVDCGSCQLSVDN